ncbi:MAG: efflux RND transporter permease subunit [Clostridium sp.]|nr:efflux RND transporter permease subunit [Clostridium sp.]
MIRQLIHRPIAVTLIVVAIAALCILSLRNIPVSLMPDIDIPRITVHVDMPGSSVREAEARGARPLRSQLMQVGGLRRIRSEAKMDGATITLEFTPGSRMDLAFIEVNEKIDRATGSLPEGTGRPKAVKAGSLDIPAFFIDINYREGAPGDFTALSDYVTGVVRKRLEQLPQTAMVDISGDANPRITIEPDRTVTDAMGISMDEIGNAIAAADLKLEALSIADGAYRYSIHFESQISTIEDIKNLLVKHDGRMLRLGDIASVSLDSSSDGSAVRHGPNRAISLAVIKQNDARMEVLSENVELLLDELRAANPNVDFTVTRDQTLLLSYSIGNLGWNLITGILLACIVLMLFMRSAKASALVIVSIPLSLMVTILCFRLIGISINIVSLAGLILGVGMMVDNSIIVIDNIMRLLCEGNPTDVAVTRGAREVFTPMLSSVLTTCSVFIPLIFLSGTAGALFYDQAMAVTISLFASLAVAMLVIPVYFRVFYKNSTQKDSQPAGMPGTRLYESALDRVLSHPKRTILLLVAVTGIGILSFPHLRKERMPDVTHTDMLAYIDWGSGISLAANDKRMSQLREVIEEDALTTTTMAGSQGFLLPHTRDLTPAESVIYIAAESSDATNRIAGKMRSWLKSHYPEATVEFDISGNIYDAIFSSGGPDLEARLQTATGALPDVAQSRRFRDSVAAAFPALDLQPVATEENLLYVADIDLMSLYDISYPQLYNRLRQITGANSVYTVNDGFRALPVVVGSGKAFRDDLLSNTIRSGGTDIPLSVLLREKRVEDYKRLYASSSGEYHPIEINAADATIREVGSRIERMANRPGSGLSVSFAGEYYESRSLISELALVLAVALGLLYFILAAQFESLLQPLVILSEVAVDTAVVFIAMWLIDESVNLMSMTGIVVMSGIVINDSILKVDTINRLRRSGMGLDRAIRTAGRQRLRPIVMTSLTTILAIVPFLRRGDMGSDLQFPLSFTLIVGMTVGTLVSLLVLPLLYKLTDRCSKDKQPSV